MMYRPTEKEMQLTEETKGWMTWEGDNWVLREDAPKHIKEHFKKMKKILSQFEY